MIEARFCSACGGRVDVITVPREPDDGQPGEERIGACERCGSLFNDAGVSELPEPDTRDCDPP